MSVSKALTSAVHPSATFLVSLPTYLPSGMLRKEHLLIYFYLSILLIFLIDLFDLVWFDVVMLHVMLYHVMSCLVGFGVFVFLGSMHACIHLPAYLRSYLLRLSD